MDVDMNAITTLRVSRPIHAYNVGGTYSSRAYYSAETVYAQSGVALSVARAFGYFESNVATDFIQNVRLICSATNGLIGSYTVTTYQ
jgi:hypothetical protein